MSLSESVLAYSDCKEFFERAMDTERGARIPFRTSKEAEYWRMRCNQFRKLDRRENMVIHEVGTKMYGRSEYDMLTMVIKESPEPLFWVYAEKRTLADGLVEDIPEDEGALLAEFEEVKLLEDQTNDDKTGT
jgi:hypothetical protein